MEKELNITLEDEETLNVELQEESDVEVKLENDTIEVVTSDYTKLNNLPQINEITLKENKTFEELGLVQLSNSEIEEILK